MDQLKKLSKEQSLKFFRKKLFEAEKPSLSKLPNYLSANTGYLQVSRPVYSKPTQDRNIPKLEVFTTLANQKVVTFGVLPFSIGGESKPGCQCVSRDQQKRDGSQLMSETIKSLKTEVDMRVETELENIRAVISSIDSRIKVNDSPAEIPVVVPLECDASDQVLGAAAQKAMARIFGNEPAEEGQKEEWRAKYDKPGVNHESAVEFAELLAFVDRNRIKIVKH